MEHHEHKRARKEAIELALWLTPVPRLAPETLSALGSHRADTGRDVGVGNQAGSDGSLLPDLGPLKPFGSWDSVAATIVRKVTTISGFNPVSTTFDEVAWNNYGYKFATAPFWSVVTNQAREVTISSLDLSKAVNAIEDMLDAIVTGDTKSAIITSIKKIGELAKENKSTTQKDNYQQQGLISVKSSVMTVGYIRSAAEMTFVSGKGYEQLTQKLNVYQTHGILDFEKCKRSASTLLSWDQTDIDEWGKETSSAPLPPNNSPAWGK